MKLTEAQRDQLVLLERVGATKNHPAFGVDFGEINFLMINQLVRAGLAAKASLRKYGMGQGERRRVGYWLTPAGRAALKEGE